MKSGFPVSESAYIGQPITIGGFNVPASHHVRYRSIDDHRRNVLAVEAIYRTTGPTFYARHEASLIGLMLTEENRLPFDLTRAAFLDIRAQVVDYNRTVQPIPNGPEKLVEWSEAKARVVLAMRHATYDRERQLVTDDIDAAVLRLCSL